MAARLAVALDPIDVYIAGITNLPPKFLACRETQHRWPEEPPPFHVVDSRKEKDRRSRGGFSTYAERVLVCERCGMERSDAYQISSLRGRTALRRIGASYTAPPGYAIEGAGQSATGMRDLLHGIVFDQTVLEGVPVAKRGRPRKDAG